MSGSSPGIMYDNDVFKRNAPRGIDGLVLFGIPTKSLHAGRLHGCVPLVTTDDGTWAIGWLTGTRVVLLEN